MLEVILGSASLDDLLDRVDSMRRISDQDVHIIEAVETRARRCAGVARSSSATGPGRRRS